MKFVFVFVIYFLLQSFYPCLADSPTQKKTNKNAFSLIQNFDQGKLEVTLAGLNATISETKDEKLKIILLLNAAIIEYELENIKGYKTAISAAKNTTRDPLSKKLISGMNSVYMNYGIGKVQFSQTDFYSDGSAIDLLNWQIDYKILKNKLEKNFKSVSISDLEKLKHTSTPDSYRSFKVKTLEALFYFKYGKYDQAIPVTMSAVDIYKKLNLPPISSNTEVIINLLWRTPPYVARIYRQKINEVEKDSSLFRNNDCKIAVNYFNALVNYSKRDLELSKYFINKAYELSKEINPAIINFVAIINYELKDYKTALLFYNKLRAFSSFQLEAYKGCGCCAFMLGEKSIFYKYNQLIIKECLSRQLTEQEYSTVLLYVSQFSDPKYIDLIYKKSKNNINNFSKTTHNCAIQAVLANNFFYKNDFNRSVFHNQLSLLSLLPGVTELDVYAPLDLQNCTSRGSLITALNNKGEAFYQLSKIATSRQEKIKNLRACYENLLLSIEQMYLFKMQQTAEEEKYVYSNLKAHKYPNIIKVCLELYNITNDPFYKNEAFRFAEQSKASVLLEILRSNNGFLVGMIPKELKQKEDSITTAISLIKSSYKGTSGETGNSILSKINALTKEKEDIENIYKTRYPDYYKLKFSQESVQPGKIQKNLSNNECVIEYLLSRNFLITYYLDKMNFIIRTDTLSLKNINLNTLASGYYHKISKYNLESYHPDSIQNFAKMSNQLYNILIKPYKQHIGNKNIIIVGDNALNRIPFETLISFIPQNPTSYKNLPYLAKSNSVNYVPSATLWMELKEKPYINRRARLLAMAPIHTKLKVQDNISNIMLAVRSDTSLLNFLPNALNEITYAHETAGGTTLFGEKASETNFKKLAKNFDLIHLATHGILDTVSPLMSKLIFSNTDEKKEDGLLHLYEIYNLHQSAQLVILSACNTGSGENYGGEGVINLARGFLSSGSRSVIMTDWSVNDQSSYELMKSFYDHLKSHRTLSETLTDSKIDYLEKADNLHSHPYFWAGYQVFGDASVKLNIYNNNKLYLLVGIFGSLTVLLIVGFKLKLTSSLTRKLFPYRKNAS